MTALDNAPAHWTRTTIGEIAEVRLGRQRSPENHSGDDMRPYLRAANVTWYSLRLDDVAEMNFTDDEMETYRLRVDDILVVEGGTPQDVGKCALVTRGTAGHAFQNTLIRLRPHDHVDPRWLMYRLNADGEMGGYSSIARGAGNIQHLSVTRYKGHSLAIPPLAEQQRVVAEIERFVTRVVGLRDRLGADAERIDRLDEVVAHVAVSGRWSEPTDLVHLPQREGRISADLLPELDLPVGWAWASLDELAEVQSGQAKSSRNVGRDGWVERPYLSTANVQRGRLDLSEIRTLWVPESKLDALTLRRGDVLFNEGGDKDKLGRGWVWSGQIKGCVHQNHVFRARLCTDAVEPRWLSTWGNTYGRWWFYSRGSQTTGIASINKRVLRSLPVPIPPVAEQRRLLDQLDRCAAVTRRSATQVHALEHSGAQLRRSILKAAFAGRL